jgi:predicted Zn-dependent protease
VIAEIAKRQLRHIEAGQNTPPDEGTLEGHYVRAQECKRAGDFVGALSSLCDLLTWRPTHESSWLFVGYIYGIELRRDARQQTAEDRSSINIQKDIDDERRGQLLNAVQALRIASSFDQGSEVGTESQRLLTVCYLELSEPSEAVQAARAVTEKEPANPASWANLSMAYFVNKDFSESANAASMALSLDDDDPVANYTLALLERIAENGERDARR